LLPLFSGFFILGWFIPKVNPEILGKYFYGKTPPLRYAIAKFRMKSVNLK
jgi:hypothetical protein